jgi:hypothetical protein
MTSGNAGASRTQKSGEPACAPSRLLQVQNNLKEEQARKRFGAKRHK